MGWGSGLKICQLLTLLKQDSKINITPKLISLQNMQNYQPKYYLRENIGIRTTHKGVQV
jgi:hypothetical protein